MNLHLFAFHLLGLRFSRRRFKGSIHSGVIRIYILEIPKIFMAAYLHDQLNRGISRELISAKRTSAGMRSYSGILWFRGFDFAPVINMFVRIHHLLVPFNTARNQQGCLAFCSIICQSLPCRCSRIKKKYITYYLVA